MSHQDKIFVKSHVARDLLHNAGLFRADKTVVWEYVSNSLQYVDKGVSPIVRVKLDSRKKLITISDNGRGMDWSGLQNFFVMHGENQDRLQGRVGRGRFGTGKAAAFGIANVLRVNTVRDGKLSKVELRRSDIEAMGSADEIPVCTLEREKPTSQPNGTLIEIEEVNLRTLDQNGIIAFIERHLAHWAKGATVWVNNHECEFNEPPVNERRVIKPDNSTTEILGNVELILKVAKAPLEEDLRGVDVYSNGVWHETTLAGNEGREMSQYIFGEIDVPRLDTDKSPIAAFDVSRSMKLNVNNLLVAAIHSFIGREIDKLRRELVDADKKRKSDEDSRRLAKQADEIARVINQDFNAFRQRIARVKAIQAGAFDTQNAQKIAENGDALVFGEEIPAEIVAPTGGIGTSGEGTKSNGDEPRNLNPQVAEADENAEKQAKRVLSTDKQRTAGGFRVKFENMGEEAYRASYLREERTIRINLEHPQLVAARNGGSIETPIFRHLSYEIAFCEYSIALANELENDFYDLSDVTFEIRETINRVARMAANLYAVN